MTLRTIRELDQLAEHGSPRKRRKGATASAPSSLQESLSTQSAGSGHLRAALFGLSNYASKN
jgi:hypothetical protein